MLLSHPFSVIIIFLLFVAAKTATQEETSLPFSVSVSAHEPANYSLPAHLPAHDVSTGNSNKDKAKDSEETRSELSVSVGLSFIRENISTSIKVSYEIISILLWLEFMR
jgi:hypothetical protein